MTTSALRSSYSSLLASKKLLPNPHQQALITRLDKLQHDLLKTNNPSILPGQSHEVPRGLYIYGSVGTGKSRLADLFSATLPSSITKRRVHFHEFMNECHSRLHEARKRSDYAGDPLVQIGRTIRQESRVLCFDEFQVTDIADAMILSRLFSSIWREGGVMVSTSNRHPDDLYENGLNRDVVIPFIRKVQKRCEIWEIGGAEDYRMRGVGEGGSGARVETFFTNQDLFDERLQQALQGEELQKVSLPVYGSRTLDVSTAGPDASGKKFRLISGSFEELCQASLGSADYYSLCSSARTIFLSGLRQFRSSEKDFVRRFITMIDLAYEMGARVICLSKVPLAEVFANIVPIDEKLKEKLVRNMTVKGEGGASSSMMSTFIGETEWSATGLSEASLATGGAGETDVGFAVGRAISRLYEMGSDNYGERD